MNSSPIKGRYLLSVSFVLLAVGCMSITNILGVYIAQSVTVCMMISVQSGVAFLIVAFLMSIQKKRLFPTKHMKLHIARGLMGALELYAFYYSLSILPVINVIVVENSAPIFVPFISMFWLREKINVWLWISIFIGSIGLLFTLHPSLGGFAHWAMALPFGAAIITAIMNVAIRKLLYTESHEQILFFFLLF